MFAYFHFNFTAIPVTFTKKLEERNCNFGESVEFNCETSKPCRVEWYFGDRRITTGPYEIESVDNQHKLRIPKAKLTDKGWYKCTVQDEFTEAKLVVIGKTYLFDKCRLVFSIQLTYFSISSNALIRFR